MARPEFDVFISYARSVSTPLAIDLQRELERFAKRWNQIRAVRVFRDDSSMSANSGLWSTIESALTTSKWLILIATPESAASQYVGNEVGWWLEHKGVDSIMLVLAGGHLTWNDTGGFTSESALPPVLRQAFAEEPRWVDMTWFAQPGSRPGASGSADPRFQERVADLAAPVRGVDRDELIGANIAEHRRTMRLARIAIATLATLLIAALVAGGIAVVQRNTAKRLFADAVGQRLAPEAGRILDGQIPGGIARGLQELLVAQRLKIDAEPGEYLNAMIAATEIGKIAATAPTTVAVSPTGALIATADSAHPNEIRLWDANLAPVGDPIHTDTGAYSIAVSHDGSLIAAGSRDGVVQLWDVRTHTLRGSLREAGSRGPDSAFVTNLIFTSDDKGLVVRTGDNVVRFYSSESMRQTADEILNTAWITAPRDGGVIAVAPLRGSAVEMRNPWTGSPVREPLSVVEDYDGAAHQVQLYFHDCRSFDGAGRRLLVNGRVYDVGTGRVVGNVIGSDDCSDHNAGLSPDGETVIEGGESIRVTSLTAATSPGGIQDRVVLQSVGGPFYGVGWLDQGHILAVGPGGMETLAVDLRKLRTLTPKVAFGTTPDDFAVERFNATSVANETVGYHGTTALNPIPGRLAGAHGDFFYTLDSGSAGMWDEWSFADGARRRGWSLTSDGDTSVQNLVSDGGNQTIAVRTGRRLASGFPSDKGGTLRRWDLSAGQQIGNALHVSPTLKIRDLLDLDGTRVIALVDAESKTDDPGSIWSFDLSNGTATNQHNFAEPVAAAAMCRKSNGDTVWMIAEKSGAVGFTNGQLADQISWAHPPTVAHKGLRWGNVRLTDDCRTGISWAESESLQLWDVGSGAPLGNPVPDAQLIGESSDGKELAVGFGGTQGITGFRTMPARPTSADLCAKLTSNMSHKQWDEWVSPDIEYQKVCPELPILPDD